MKKILMLCLLLPAFASAFDYRFDGYLTIGAGNTSANGVQNYLGHFYDEKIDLDYNSLIGLQGIVQFNDRFSLVSQLLLAGEDNWDVDQESWKLFYLNYQVTPGLSLKAGRFLNDVFFLSRYKAVGYAYPWIRPPRELYALAAFDDITGIGFQYNYNDFESMNLTLHSSYTKDSRDSMGFKFSTDSKIINLSVSNKNDTLEARFGYSTTTGSHNKRDLYGEYYSDILVRMGFPAFLANSAAQTIVAEDWFDSENTSIEFYSLGLRYEDHDFLVLAEYAFNDVEDNSPSSESYYLTLGYQLDKFQPHITYSRHSWTDMYDKYFVAQNPVNTAYEPLVNTVYNLAYGYEQKRIIYGLRYDPIDKLAIKAEIHKIYANGGRGYFPLPMNREYLYMLSLNYVF